MAKKKTKKRAKDWFFDNLFEEAQHPPKVKEKQFPIGPNDVLFDPSTLEGATLALMEPAWNAPSHGFRVDRFFNLCAVAEAIILHEHLFVLRDQYLS